MPSVVLLSVHYYGAAQRAGFHWMADAFAADGWQVTFAMTSLSRISRLRRDRRLKDRMLEKANRLVPISDGIRSFVLYAPVHPVDLGSRLLNRLAEPLMEHYARVPFGELEEPLRTADLVIFESASCLLFVPRIRALNARARLVYRASDDLRYNGNHPLVLRAEAAALPLFDLVSAPSQAIYERFSGHPRARLQYHGVDTAALDVPGPTPYAANGLRKAVFVGVSGIDLEFFRLAPEAAPGWEFHVIGPIGGLPQHPRIVAHGRLPFAETIPYLQHADAGLHTLAHRRGAEAFSDSLKALQYTYCGLPVVAPGFLRSARTNVLYYEPGAAVSIAGALAGAARMDRATVDRSVVRSSAELQRDIVRAAFTV